MQTKASTTSHRPVTILLVDDDPDCRMLLRDIIDAATSRADVREAPDGHAALDYLRRSGRCPDAPRPDLVYLDLEMPGLSGHDVLKAIKADAALREIPVVMLTGIDSEADRIEALRNGASHYVVKPSEPRRFLRAVATSVNRWVRLQESVGQTEACPLGGREKPDHE